MDQGFFLPPHPLGVKPTGNAYTSKERRGSPLGILPDELVLQVLELLDFRSLLAVGQVCKALFAFSRIDDLWKAFYLDSSSREIGWRGSWYASFAGIDYNQAVKIMCPDLFSDVIYRPFQCAHTPLESYTSSIPKKNEIKRLDNLIASEFTANWTNVPFILTKPVREWPVYHSWSEESLLRNYGDLKFRAEAVDWPLQTYLRYMNNTDDESPLYLFDRAFANKMHLNSQRGGDYWIPECFGEDLFAVLGEQRPDSKWLIIGPERSGSTFHKDPNATSAWNAVIRGSKYWIMFPAGPSLPPPPGVYVSEDQSEVTSPLSIAEWLLEFHSEARATPGCAEGICHEGEVLHVPSGWWHLVVNLSPSIAITQNFVPEVHLKEVLLFLRDKPDQVSGFKSNVEDPYNLFVARLKDKHPELLAAALAKIEKSQNFKKRKWDELVNGNDPGENTKDQSNGFSFGFAEDDEDIP